MKRIISLALLALVALQANAQNDLEEIRKTTNSWYGQITPDELPKGAKEKTIDFVAQSYSINGYFSKGSLIEGQMATIYDTESEIRVHLKGKVSFMANRLYITGIKYDYLAGSINETYGTFLVSNSEGMLMQYAPKKAGELRCNLTNLEHYVCKFNSRPVLISLGDKLSEQTILIVGNKLGDSFSLIKAKLPANTITAENYTNFSQFIPLIKDVKSVEYCDGSTFEGSVITKVNDEGHISLTKLYGRLDHPGDQISFISVYKSGGNKVMNIAYKTPVNNIKQEILTVPANVDFDETELWNSIYFYTHLSTIQNDYSNGSKYVGSAKVKFDAGSNNPRITLTTGTYYYPNGDYFKGDISGKTFAGFFTDGTTYLKDGRTFKGDFLSKYKLTSQQISNISNLSNPTTAIERAEEYDYSNRYTEYKSIYGTWEGVGVWYFDPMRGYNGLKMPVFGIVYCKETDFYSIKNKFNETVLEVKIDKNGRHVEEIIFDTDNNPKYINFIKSNPDGKAETIRTYHYDTKELYLVLNYFSDGALRSAYEYRFNEDKKPVVVRSKESHPSFTNSYTCKLYDFNGNYERTINWGIGESHSLFDSGVVRVETPVLNLYEFEIGKFDYIHRAATNITN